MHVRTHRRLDVPVPALPVEPPWVATLASVRTAVDSGHFARADTILATRATHLLGLLLAEDAARAAGDEAAAVAAHRKMLELGASERQAGLPEYESHATELTAALGRPAPASTPARR